MAGLISVNKEKTWSAANWVFDHILRISRKHLPKEGSARVVELLENIVPGLYSISLEKLSTEEMKIFRETLEAAYKEVLFAGRESFREPEFYPGFMKRFEELIEMIPSDR